MHTISLLKKLFQGRSILSLALAIFLLSSCQTSPKDIPVIDADKPSGTIDLSWSDILEDICMVALETTDDILIDNSENPSAIYVSNRYIVAANTDEVHLFDKNGKHLRKLMVRGNGPNEFTYITNVFIDEKRDILYYTNPMDPQKNRLFRVNLKDGSFLDPLIPPLRNFTLGAMDAEGYFYLLPVSESYRDTIQTSDLIYKYLPETGEVQTFSGSYAYAATTEGTSISHYKGVNSFFQFRHSDTLFSLSGKRLSPQGVFKQKNRITDLLTDGDDLSLVFSFKGGHLMEIYQSTSTIINRDGQQILSRRPRFAGYFVFDTQGQFQTVKKIHIDPFALDIDMEKAIKREQQIYFSPIPRISGNWGYVDVSAVNMVELIDQTLEKKEVSPSQAKKLEEIRAQITEDSNPVFIIGKLK